MCIRLGLERNTNHFVSFLHLAKLGGVDALDPRFYKCQSLISNEWNK